MLHYLRKLVGQSAIYGLSFVGNAIAQLLVTPVLLHRLSRPEYGITEVLNVFASMILTVSTLGIASILVKVYISDCESDQERKVLVSSVMAFATVLAAGLSIAAALGANQVSQFFFRSSRYGVLIQLAIGSSGLLLIQQMVLLSLRAADRAGRYITVTLTQLGTITLGNLYFVWFRGYGVHGVQYAAIAGSTASLLIGLVMIRSMIVPQLSLDKVKYVLRKSIPLIPVSVIPWTLNWSDRFFLNHFASLSVTGLYAVGYKIGMMPISMAYTAFGLAWVTMHFANRDNQDGPRLCFNALKYYLLMLVAIGLCLSVFSREILRVLAKPQYWSAGVLVPFISLAYILFGLYTFSVPIFVGAERGKWLSGFALCIVALNLALNSLLIPRYGAYGATAATLITFMVQGIVAIVMAARIYPMPFDKWSVVRLGFSAVAVLAVFYWLPLMGLKGVLIKSLTLPSFFALLFLLRFFGDKELAALRGLSGKIRGKLLAQQGKAA